MLKSKIRIDTIHTNIPVVSLNFDTLILYKTHSQIYQKLIYLTFSLTSKYIIFTIKQLEQLLDISVTAYMIYIHVKES